MNTAAPTLAPAPARAEPGHRFDRQLGVPGLGPAEQERLRAATVVVAGIGGVGGACATYLAAAGVGRLVLIHPGDLELPDRNRQTLMRPEDLGRSRVAAAARTLKLHYPDVEVSSHDVAVAHADVPRLIGDADLVVDARHNFPERYLLNRLCRQGDVPAVIAAMDSVYLQLMTSVPDGPCWRCVFPIADSTWDPLGFRVLGAVAGTVGCLAAVEVVKVLIGVDTALTGRLLYGDLWKMDFQTLSVRRSPTCPDCTR